MGGSKQFQINDYIVLATSVKGSFCRTHKTIIVSSRSSTLNLFLNKIFLVSLLYLEMMIQNPKKYFFQTMNLEYFSYQDIYSHIHKHGDYSSVSYTISEVAQVVSEV